MNITSFCIRRPVTTAMFFAILALLGIISSTRMPIDLYPEITFPAINVNTGYSGAGPEEVEQLITIPIERAVSSINKVRSITSISQEGRSRVTVYFDWGVDLEDAVNTIRANLDRVGRRLPDDADTPSAFQYDPSSAPIMTIGLSGNMETSFLRELAEEEITYQLQRADGVAAVEVRGGQNREILVALKRERLAALGITINQVASAVRSENILRPAGALQTGTAEFSLRTHGQLRQSEEIKNIIVANRNGIPIYLRDLGTVEEKDRNVEAIVRIDGRPGVVMSLQKQSGSNTVAVADRVYKIISELRRRYPDINIRVLNDSSLFIRDSVKGVSNAAVFGACLAGLVLLFFLHNIRATVIAAVVMPISILATLILAFWGKMTLNSISLGGLALGVGMLVDNTIVIIDNISRKLEHPDIPPEQAALEGTREMAPAITASTLTTICVFFPLIYITGQTGIIFTQLAYMVIFSLICSLAVAVTLTPMLSARYFQNHQAEKRRRPLVSFAVRLQEGWDTAYRRFLSKCLQKKALVIAGCLLVFLATLLLWPLIGTELIGETDEGIISLSFTLPPGTKIEETDMVARQFEEIINSLPELENREVTVGSGFGGAGHRGSITLRLVERGRRQRSTMDIVRELQTKLVYPGARIRIFARNSMRMLYSRSQSAVAIDIRGHNLELARETAGLIMNRLQEVAGVSNVSISREEETPEFAIKINRQRAADLGVTAAQIAEAINSGVSGQTATTLRREGQELPVRVTLQESDIASLQDLEQILIAGRNNRVFPLSSMVEIELTNRPVSIERTDRERNITVTADLDRRDLSAAMRDIQNALAGLNLPQGINLYYSGDFEEQQRGFNELKWALILALLLVYMIMASQFESLLDPLIIMLSVPFTLGGVLIILLLTDTAFNNQVYIGLIILAGVVVNNAIVLISYFRLLMERGLSVEEAVLNGAALRLRPILMTTITTVLALTPMATGLGGGANLQAPMARAVIGGLLFASILTLALIPVVFTAVENSSTRRKHRAAERGLRARTLKTGVLLFMVLGLMLVGQSSVLARTREETRKITLAEALHLAMANSEEAKIMAAGEESIRSNYRQTTGGKALQAYAEAKAVNPLEPGAAGSIELILEKTVPAANLFGGKSYSDLLAGQNLHISLLDLQSQKVNFISQVITAYQNQLSAGRDLELAEENHRRAVRFNEEIMVKAKVGLTSITDETGAAVQVSNAQTALDQAVRQYELAGCALRRLLAVDESVELVLAPPEKAGLDQNLDLLLAAAYNNRADLERTHLELARAETLYALAKLSQQMGISLAWSFQGENYRTEINLSNLGRDGAGEWKISGNAGLLVQNQNPQANPEPSRLELVLRWNLSDGNVRREQVKQAELLVSQCEEEWQRTKKSVEYQVKEAYYNYLDLENRLQSSALQLQHNRIYLEALEAKYRTGLASTKEVLEAQLLLNQAELQYEQVKSNLYLAHIRLLAATGQLSAENFQCKM